MKDAQRSIFREEAIRRYIESNEKTVLPQLISPQTFAYLWFLLGLLCASSLVAWFVKVPLYASGSAIVVRWNDDLNHQLNDTSHQNPTEQLSGDVDNGEIVIAAFFPSQFFSNLQVAQNVVLEFDALGDRFTQSIQTVEPQIVSPDVIHKHYALSAQTTPFMTQPATVAIIPLKPISNTVPTSTYLGSVGRAEVEVGSQRLIALLPLIGQIFD